MAWLGKAFAFLSQAKKVIEFLNGLFAMVKDAWLKHKARKAEETVDETTKTGDQRAEEAVIGDGSGKPHVDPNGGLRERPVKDRS